MNTNSPYTRSGLIESIATAAALAQTANTDTEYLHWDNRRADLEKKAGLGKRRRRANPPPSAGVYSPPHKATWQSTARAHWRSLWASRVVERSS